MQQLSHLGSTHAKDMYNLNKIQNYAKFAIRKLPPPPPPFTKNPQNYTPHLKHKRKQLQIQITQHINRYIKIQLLPLNNHKLEFTATQSVCDSNRVVLQGRPNSSSLPQPVIHMSTPLYITTDALSIHCINVKGT